jgi:hypothetical protein
MTKNNSARNNSIKVGDKFHNFTVVDTTKKWHKTHWRNFFICKCYCGYKVLLTGVELRKAKNNSYHNCHNRSITSSPALKVKIGDQFGYWEVLSSPFIKNKLKYVNCRCKCGEEKAVHLYNLAMGKTKSCPACSKSGRIINRLKKNFNGISAPRELIGKKVGKRLILDYILLKKGYHYKVQCICGKISYIRQGRIQNNETTTCRNCNKTDIVKIGHIFGKRKIIDVQIINGRRIYKALCQCGNEMVGRLSKFKNRDECVSCAQRKSGPIRRVIFGYDEDITGIWNHIFDRCYNENHHAYHLYGGRGIKVHPRYFDMQNFIDDLGPRPTKEHSVDRIDPDRGYSPGNIKWADKKEQAQNRRRSKKNRNLYITVKREDLCKKCLENCLKIKL